MRCVEELLQDMATYLSTPPAAPEVPAAALLSQGVGRARALRPA